MHEMPLRQRQRSEDEDEQPYMDHQPHHQYDEKAAKTAAALKMATRMRGCLLLVLVAVIVLFVVFDNNGSSGSNSNSNSNTHAVAIMMTSKSADVVTTRSSDDTNVVVIRRNLFPPIDGVIPVMIYLYLHKPSSSMGKEEEADSNTNAISSSYLGPHQVKVVIHGSIAVLCKNPRLAIRLFGDALVNVYLQEQDKLSTSSSSSSSSSSQQHDVVWTSGYFTLPIAGSYTLEAQWYGCQEAAGLTRKDTKTLPLYTGTSLASDIKVQAMNHGDNSDVVKKEEDDTDSISRIFTPGATWLSTRFMDMDPAKKMLNPYIWTDPNRVMNTLEQSTSSFIEIKNALVSKEGVARAKEGFYEFASLGNYELLCFIGGTSMANIHAKFLELRPYIAAHQRPFKFHLYEMTTFAHPDQNWTDETKKRLRKCKHMLVALQDFQDDTSVSQTLYKQQVMTFVGHLLNVMNDDTFPIRLFTWTTAAINNSGKRFCQDDRFLPPTTDHPCNDVIKHLLGQGNGVVFPPRVNLLDNTDLSLPWAFPREEQALEDQNHHYPGAQQEEIILANIALRIFVVAGKQVADWRAVGQHGKIDGLHRNGIIEPNFELLPYTGWSQ